MPFAIITDHDQNHESVKLPWISEIEMVDKTQFDDLSSDSFQISANVSKMKIE